MDDGGEHLDNGGDEFRQGLGDPGRKRRDHLNGRICQGRQILHDPICQSQDQLERSCRELRQRSNQPIQKRHDDSGRTFHQCRQVVRNRAANGHDDLHAHLDQLRQMLHDDRNEAADRLADDLADFLKIRPRLRKPGCELAQQRHAIISKCLQLRKQDRAHDTLCRFGALLQPLYGIVKGSQLFNGFLTEDRAHPLGFLGQCRDPL